VVGEILAIAIKPKSMFADIHLLLLITFLNRRTREMIFSYQHSGSSRSSAAYDSSYSGHFHFCLTAFFFAQIQSGTSEVGQVG
jgi:hypothetical protein